MLRVQNCDELFSIFASARKTALRLSEFCVGACAGEFFISAFFALARKSGKITNIVRSSSTETISLCKNCNISPIIIW